LGLISGFKLVGHLHHRSTTNLTASSKCEHNSNG
jgi:hypothetical protein